MIRLTGISKHFPGVQALDDVSFGIAAGECHALLGENGAGKSTLGKILAGVYQADAGQIELAGQPVRFHRPHDAAAAGVAIVHQELLFCPNLSVAENLCLHDLPRSAWGIDYAETRRRARTLLAEVGLGDLDVSQPMARLSIAQEQLVQIAAALGGQARVIVFDEPTSSLGTHEVQRLFELIRRLQSEGVTIVYVSHRLEEIFELCQTVTVLRDGKHVATKPIGEVDHDELVRLMVGRQVSGYQPPPMNAVEQRAERLRVENFTSPGKFAEVSFSLRSGEIVGLAGLVGAGRTELAEALFGLDPQARGQMWLDGQAVAIRHPRQACRLGLGLVPEDRKRQGLVLPLAVRENLSLPILDRLRRLLGWTDRAEERRLAEEYRSRMAIRTASLETATASLSGGNQQKIVLAKWLAAGGRVLIVDEPTRGVDVGAKQEIHTLLGDLARSGMAVLVISSELPELLALADRVLVLRAGRLVAELPRQAADPETVLRHMAGVESPAAEVN